MEIIIKQLLNFIKLIIKILTNIIALLLEKYLKDKLISIL
jgi:hypothetical protein